MCIKKIPTISFDIVGIKLIKHFKKLKAGTKGCIVVKYTENDFEVEFFDENNEKWKNKTKLY